MSTSTSTAQDLTARSNRLGADPRNTNYTGGNTSAKGRGLDPVTYAKRTLLGEQVLPEHVGDAVYALTAGDLSQTTGLHIPVDSGVAAAFLR